MPTSTKHAHTPASPQGRDRGMAGAYTITRDGRSVATSQVFDDEVAAAPAGPPWSTASAPSVAEAILLARLGVEASATMTTAEWLRRYVDRLTGIEAATRKRYHRYVELDVVPFMGEPPVGAYTEELDAARALYLATEVCYKPGRWCGVRRWSLSTPGGAGPWRYCRRSFPLIVS
ncbi:hypothetical protein ACW2Q0_00865 [Nocardia sp. R16R-3T]